MKNEVGINVCYKKWRKHNRLTIENLYKVNLHLHAHAYTKLMKYIHSVAHLKHYVESDRVMTIATIHNCNNSHTPHAQQYM